MFFSKRCLISGKNYKAVNQKGDHSALWVRRRRPPERWGSAGLGEGGRAGTSLWRTGNSGLRTQHLARPRWPGHSKGVKVPLRKSSESAFQRDSTSGKQERKSGLIPPHVQMVLISPLPMGGTHHVGVYLNKRHFPSLIIQQTVHHRLFLERLPFLALSSDFLSVFACFCVV